MVRGFSTNGGNTSVSPTTLDAKPYDTLAII
jgi:hypothetical protein